VADVRDSETMQADMQLHDHPLLNLFKVQQTREGMHVVGSVSGVFDFGVFHSVKRVTG
jgi:hypothetical protein